MHEATTSYSEVFQKSGRSQMIAQAFDIALAPIKDH
jgi:hypothetical protein